MKKYELLSTLLSCFFVSCIHTDTPDINGMWQLTSIQDRTGCTQTIDTIYYSFQGQKLFTCTLLNAGPLYSDPTIVLYGYVNFPAQNQLHIQMDQWTAPYLSFLPWRSESVNYFIRKLTSKEMILEDDGVIYRLNKF
ncbi:MAG: lipocalin-like domain-containing protein [Dysgonamonadaceae bacterium]|jgi:hypothetical protein|nr:lipocalin-like domain-containing protein [Dysgonamonadaceae bacterium]